MQPEAFWMGHDGHWASYVGGDLCRHARIHHDSANNLARERIDLVGQDECERSARDNAAAVFLS
jgi:hypothetical protein